MITMSLRFINCFLQLIKVQLLMLAFLLLSFSLFCFCLYYLLIKCNETTCLNRLCLQAWKDSSFARSSLTLSTPCQLEEYARRHIITPKLHSHTMIVCYFKSNALWGSWKIMSKVANFDNLFLHAKFYVPWTLVTLTVKTLTMEMLLKLKWQSTNINHI